MNILILVFDSLRYDVAMSAYTPNLSRLIAKHQKYLGKWVKVYAQATFTLPAHVAMLSAGVFPCDYHLPEPFGRINSLFGIKNQTKKKGHFMLSSKMGIPVYFAQKGFKTVGIGGVTWFNPDNPNSSFWKDYFQEYYWDTSFSEYDENNFQNQIQFMKERIEFEEDNFVFMNVASTHEPFLNFGNSRDGQIKSLEYVDKHIMDLIGLFESPMKVVLVSDHGNCFGEEGMWGRGFYHEKVMEVPMAFLEVE